VATRQRDADEDFVRAVVRIMLDELEQRGWLSRSGRRDQPALLQQRSESTSDALPPDRPGRPTFQERVAAMKGTGLSFEQLRKKYGLRTPKPPTCKKCGAVGYQTRACGRSHNVQPKTVTSNSR
jgi:hypothetical protein